MRADFRLGDWLVEPSLDRISDGDRVRHVRPLLMDLLVFLARSGGRVLPKEEILEQVWQRRFVSESVLTRSVADLRVLLGDDTGSPRYIETIPKRGYRLIPSAVPAAPAAGPEPTRSVVVLPFADLGPANDQEYFCDGLAEELTNALAQLPGLRVVARTSAFAFKGLAVDVREVGRRLGVGAVLEGGVQRAGDRLRVTVQLIDAGDGCHVWSHRFDGTAHDVFAIEDHIVGAVTAALRVRLLGGIAPDLRRGRTADPAAHDRYLQGRYVSARRTGDALVLASRLFEEAIAIDPGYAAAYASLGECHAVRAFLGIAPPQEAFPAARRAAGRAVALAPDLAEGHAVLAHALGMYEWRWAEAEDHFRQALRLGPSLAVARMWYSHLLAAGGRFADAVAETERACECDPLSPIIQTALGVALYYARDHDRAAHRFRAVLDAQPSFALAHFHLGRLLLCRGDIAAAADELEAAAPGFPLALGHLASARRLLGRKRAADAALAELERLAGTVYVGPLARASAYIGDRAQRLAWLEQAFDAHEGPVPLLNTDPSFDDLRAEPAFRLLLDRLGLPRVELPAEPTAHLR